MSTAITLKPIEEQVIVITGASSGIGLATVQLAADRGAKLVLASRSEKTLRATVKELQARGREAIYMVTDVAKRADLERLAEAALAKFGRIDTWINNAGVSIYGRLEDISEADSRRLFDVNFWGVVNGSLVAVKHMRATGGTLINVGSEVSEAVVPLQGMYAASKHAVKGFTDALRLEVEVVDKAPISITLIQPTAVDTPFPQHAKNYMTREPKLPSPQIDPERVAAAILKAATQPTRDMKVGMMAKLNTAISKFAPTLGDRMAASYTTRQQHDEPPRDPEGTLYKPGESGHTHGEKRAQAPS